MLQRSVTQLQRSRDCAVLLHVRCSLPLPCSVVYCLILPCTAMYCLILPCTASSCRNQEALPGDEGDVADDEEPEVLDAFSRAKAETAAAEEDPNMCAV